MRPLIRAGAVIAASALLPLSLVIAPHAAQAAGACTPATNIEAIVDDSGSMDFSDPDVNRGHAVELLFAQSTLQGKTLGAIEFGSGSNSDLAPGDTNPADGYTAPSDPSYEPAADTLFAPTAISAASLQNVVVPVVDKTSPTTKLKADSGSTDYNAAFAQAAADNPTANARIFITDGGHNAYTYQNGHRGGPHTYVIGLGIGGSGQGDSDADRLQTIANETGGVYYPNVDSGNIQATVAKIAAALSCGAISQTFTNTFTAAGQVQADAVRVKAATSALDVTLTWTSPLDKFTIAGASFGGTAKHHGSARIATFARTRAGKKVHFTLTTGPTYVTAHLTKLQAGKLRLQLKAVQLGSGSAGVALTTQVQPTKAHAKPRKHHHKHH